MLHVQVSNISLSAMTRDVEMARKVNIIPEEALDNADEKIILDKSKAQDFYRKYINSIKSR